MEGMWLAKEAIINSLKLLAGWRIYIAGLVPTTYFLLLLLRYAASCKYGSGHETTI